MILNINHRDIDELNFDELAAYESICQYPEFFTEVNYLAINWLAVNEHIASGRFDIIESKIGTRINSEISPIISVCSASEILAHPSFLKSIGLSILYCTFWVGRRQVDRLNRFGVEIRFYRAFVPQLNFRPADNGYMVYVRARGKRKSSLEISLLDMKRITSFEPSNGRIIFEGDALLECEILNSNEFVESQKYLDILDKSQLVLCQAPNEIQDKVLWHSITRHIVPVLPGFSIHTSQNIPVLNELIQSNSPAISEFGCNLTDNLIAFVEAKRELIVQLFFMNQNGLGSISEMLYEALNYTSTRYYRGSKWYRFLSLLSEGNVSDKRAKLIVHTFVNHCLFDEQNMIGTILDIDVMSKIKDSYLLLECQEKNRIDRLLRARSLSWLMEFMNE